MPPRKKTAADGAPAVPTRSSARNKASSSAPPPPAPAPAPAPAPVKAKPKSKRARANSADEADAPVPSASKKKKKDETTDDVAPQDDQVAAPVPVDKPEKMVTLLWDSSRHTLT